MSLKIIWNEQHLLFLLHLFFISILNSQFKPENICFVKYMFFSKHVKNLFKTLLSQLDLNILTLFVVCLN